jgi:hypothetical protein
MTMKLLTKTTRRKDRGLIVLLWINRAQILCALDFALSLCGHAATPSRFNFGTNKSFAHPPAIKENFITVERLGVRYIESGSGPTIVMIHGNVGSVEDFEFGAADILSSNYHVIAGNGPGYEIPGTHSESIYNALGLITSPIRVSDVSRGEVHGVVREISTRDVLLDQAYEVGKRKRSPSKMIDQINPSTIN